MNSLVSWECPYCGESHTEVVSGSLVCFRHSCVKTNMHYRVVIMLASCLQCLEFCRAANCRSELCVRPSKVVNVLYECVD